LDHEAPMLGFDQVTRERGGFRQGAAISYQRRSVHRVRPWRKLAQAKLNRPPR
jgi:hypothetical protein